MNQQRYSNILLGFLAVVLATSLFLISNVKFSMINTNVKTNYQFEGATDKTTVTKYYASTGDYFGGAMLVTNDDIVTAIVTFNDTSTVTHHVTPILEDAYVLDVVKGKVNNLIPTQIVVYNENNEEVDTIALQHTLGELYSFTDGNQTYRHIYMNQAGIFLGEYVIETLSSDVQQIITLEFCHKDETKSEGYHLLAKKQMSLGKFVSGEDLGFLPFLSTAKYDANKDVYVIITFSNTNVSEIPLVKGVN